MYSFEGDDWSGTIPALEYGGFLPVGAAKMLPGYDGPNYGLARRDDEGSDYGKHLVPTCAAISFVHIIRLYHDATAAMTDQIATLPMQCPHMLNAPA